jgi:assimilatory nitrate reductase catalytic subunit
MRHAPEPCIDIHSLDAAARGIEDGALVEIRTRFGAAVLKASVGNSVRVGEIFAPMHWSDDFAPQARANALVNPAVDPRSGQPEFKHTPATLAPAAIAWRGFYVSRLRRDPPGGVWWRRIPQAGGQLYEIAAPPDAPSLREIGAALFADFDPESWAEASDRKGAFLRRAAIIDGKLQRALLVTINGGLPARDWLCDQLRADHIDEAARRVLLTGGLGGERRDYVCACFDVTREQIEALARAEPGAGIARVGAALKAGTNCGSCRPEIARITARCAAPIAPELAACSDG